MDVFRESRYQTQAEESILTFAPIPRPFNGEDCRMSSVVPPFNDLAPRLACRLRGAAKFSLTRNFCGMLQ